MRLRRSLRVIFVALVAFGVGPAHLTLAVHETTNLLVFEPVAQSPAPDASGDGVIEFRGLSEPDSQWTVAFAFNGLRTDTAYSIVVQGRFGEDGSTDATAFTPICAFRATADGHGDCWFYLVGLRRLAVVQVREGGANGAVVLQASRKDGGPGSIVGIPPAPSPVPAATPLASSMLRLA